MLDGLLGGDPQYDATQLPIDEPLVQPPESAPGILLRIRPFKENQGVVDGAGLLQSVHDVTTNFRGKNTSDHHSFEVWFDEGKVKFFMHAATGRPPTSSAAASANNYANSEVFPVDGGAAFPVIDPDEYVAGAWLEMEKLPYYPIRHHNSDEWATDPTAKSRARCSHSTTARSSRKSSSGPQNSPGRTATGSSTTASTTSPTHSGKEHQLDGSIPKRGQRARRTSRPPKPSNSSVASKRSTSTSASSQPPRTRTKPKRVPVGSPGCSESTTTP